MDHLLETLLAHCAGLYRIDLRAVQYETVKAYPPLQSSLEEAGTLQHLLDVFFDARSETSASGDPKPQALNEGDLEAFRFFVRFLILPSDLSPISLLMVYLAGQERDTGYVFLAEYDRLLHSGIAACGKMQPSETGFLYYMPVDAEDADGCEPDPGASLSERNSDRILNRIELEVRLHYSSRLTLRELADKYYINSAYLGQLFLRRHGLSFSEYLRRIRLSHAAFLLANTGKYIYEIIREVGCSNVNYFNRKFTELYGMSPSAYRKAARSSPEASPSGLTSPDRSEG